MIVIQRPGFGDSLTIGTALSGSYEQAYQQCMGALGFSGMVGGLLAGGYSAGPLGALLGSLTGGALGALAGRNICPDYARSNSDPTVPNSPDFAPINFSPLTPPHVDPLVLNLSGSQLSLISLANSQVSFDFGETGYQVRTGWVGPTTGILINDANGNNQVDGDSELFGSATQDGFDALAALDQNGDGKIDAQDQGFANLRVWTDLNSDGVQQTGELFSLADLQIASIGLNRTSSGQTIEGNSVRYTGQFTRTDGSTGLAATVYFQTNPLLSTWVAPEGFTVSDAAQALPQLRGYGNVRDLWAAMTLDDSFRQEVSQLVHGPVENGMQLRSEFEQLVMRWAGVPDTLDPGARGPAIDARHLEVVEAFYGTTYAQYTRSGVLVSNNPTQNTAQPIEDTYNNIIDGMLLRFVSQVSFSQALALQDFDPSSIMQIISNPMIVFSDLFYNPSTDTLQGDLQATLTNIVSHVPSNPHNALAYLETVMPLLNGARLTSFGGNTNDLVNAVRDAAAPYLDPFLTNFAVSSLEHNIAFGSSADTQLTGTRPDEVLIAGSGNETIHAASGNSIVVAGAGNDTVNGGDGNDTFVYEAADGNLIISDHVPPPYWAPRNNTLRLLDLNPDQVTFSRRDNDLTMTVNATGRTVLIPSNFASSTYDGIQNIVFANGTTWDRNHMTAAAWYRAGVSDETVRAEDGDATLVSGNGNDTLWGGEGNDTFVYASSNGNLRIEDHSQYEWNPATHQVDWVWWKNGVRSNTLLLSDLNASDIYASRNGNDLILSAPSTGRTVTVAGEFLSTDRDGVQQITFGDGTSWNRDQIAAAAPYRASIGNHVVTAVNGNATLYAGTGDDTLVGGDMNNDRAADTFVYARADGNLDIEAHVFAWNSVSNTLQLNDLNASDILLERAGGDLQVLVRPTGRVITIGGELNSTNHDGVQQIAFADGTTWNRNQIQAHAAYTAGPGNVTVTAPNGDAILVAGTGNDTLVGGDINNNASDTFVYAAADGNLDIEAHVYSWNTLNNTLQLLDLNASGLTFTRVNNDLQIAVNTTGRVITVTNEFSSVNHDGVQQIAFADGTNWNRAQIGSHTPYRAGPGDVTVTLANGDVAFAAGSGNDTVIAGDMWNNASDTFFYSAANGNLDIEAHVYSWNAINNTLNLSDLNASDLTVSRVNNNLRLTVNATGRTITVGNEFNSTNHDGVQQIVFANGNTWNRAQIGSNAPYRAGPGDVTMTLANGDVAFAAGSGNDTVIAGDMWNNASDTFFYSAANGNLDIEAHVYSWNAINNTLRLTDLNPLGVTLARVNNDLRVTVNATGRVITVTNEFSSTNHDGVQQIAFADGTTWNRSQIGSNAPYRAGPGDITVTMANGDGAFVAGTGNDTVIAGDMWNNASDRFSYASADGNLDIEAHVYSWNNLNDTLQLADLNASDVTLSRVNNDLHVTVNATGHVITVGNEFHSTNYDGIQQIAFADGTTLNRTQIQAQAYVRGTDGNDVLGTSSSPFGIGGVTFDLGRGNDSVYTNWANNETVLYYAGDGSDTYRLWDGSASANVLQLPDLAPGDLTLHRTGDDLLIGFHNSADTITFSNEFTNNNYGINGISFGTGATWDRNYIGSHLS